MRRPPSVIVAAALQLSTVVPFLLGTYVVLRYGAACTARRRRTGWSMGITMSGS
jgi:hypothetical protein